MRIGFDLDGVLATQSIQEIVINKVNPFLEKIYYDTLKPNLNPYMFLKESDKGFIISARRKELHKVTKRWCDKWFPALKLCFAERESWRHVQEMKHWHELVAESKSKVINRLKLDVYFEDLPEVVNALRKLCPRTKIIQYGGRLEWSSYQNR